MRITTDAALRLAELGALACLSLAVAGCGQGEADARAVAAGPKVASLGVTSYQITVRGGTEEVSLRDSSGHPAGTVLARAAQEAGVTIQWAEQPVSLRFDQAAGRLTVSDAGGRQATYSRSRKGWTGDLSILQAARTQLALFGSVAEDLRAGASPPDLRTIYLIHDECPGPGAGCLSGGLPAGGGTDASPTRACNLAQGSAFYNGRNVCCSGSAYADCEHCTFDSGTAAWSCPAICY